MILVSQWLFFSDMPTPGGLRPRNDRSNGFTSWLIQDFSGFYPSERYPERVTFVLEGCITMYHHVLAVFWWWTQPAHSNVLPFSVFAPCCHPSTMVPRGSSRHCCEGAATPLGDKKGVKSSERCAATTTTTTATTRTTTTHPTNQPQ